MNDRRTRCTLSRSPDNPRPAQTSQAQPRLTRSAQPSIKSITFAKYEQNINTSQHVKLNIQHSPSSVPYLQSFTSLQEASGGKQTVTFPGYEHTDEHSTFSFFPVTINKKETFKQTDQNVMPVKRHLAQSF